MALNLKLTSVKSSCRDSSRRVPRPPFVCCCHAYFIFKYTCVHLGSILRINQTGRVHLVCHVALSEHTHFAHRRSFLPQWRDDGRQSLCNTLNLLPASKLYEIPGSQKSGICFSKRHHPILSNGSEQCCASLICIVTPYFPRTFPELR